MTINSFSDRDATEMFRRPPDNFVDVGQGEVAHRRVGQGPDVLFVHGWPVSGATFRKLLPHLVPHLTCHVIDLPGAGSSRFGPATRITVADHVESVRRVVDELGLEDLAVVGHDSGGLIARHALAGDARVRAWGLIDTEQPQGVNLRFRQFLVARHLPGFESVLGGLIGSRRLRRHPLILGGAFTDTSLLDGEFDEFFLRPIHEDRARRRAAAQLLDSFDLSDVARLEELHRRIKVPVKLVWGERDMFFPVNRAEEMVPTFADAELEVIPDTRLFSHEERPAEVARALLPTLAGAAYTS